MLLLLLPLLSSLKHCAPRANVDKASEVIHNADLASKIANCAAQFSTLSIHITPCMRMKFHDQCL